MKQAKVTEKRVAMTYEFEDLLNQLRSKKEKSQQQTEAQRMNKLNKILSQSIEKFQLNIKGNTTTQYKFIEEELNVQIPNNIENCSIQIFDGINRLKEELDLIDTANAVIDIDSNDPSTLICDLSLKEKSRLTASIGASHDVNAFAQLNGSLSVGVRNVFGAGEKLDLCADLGLGTTNEFNKMLSLSNNSSINSSLNDDNEQQQQPQDNKSIYNLVHNTSNQYSITFSKPRMKIPINPFFPFDQSDKNENMNKSSLMLKGFKQQIDRRRSSSYMEESLGTTSMLISPNKEHCILYNYHLRSLIPCTRSAAAGMDDTVISSASVDDEYMKWMNVKSSVSYKYVRDTRNHASIPSSGYLLNAETEIAGIGGDVDFIRSTASFYYHWSMPRVTTNVDPPNISSTLSSILNVGIQTGLVIPWKKRFLSSKFGGGGDNNVRIIDRIIPMAGLQARGFEHAQIGPKDRNDYVHADFLIAGGTSLCLPIFEWLYANIFFNVCNCGLLRNTNSINDIISNGVASTGISALIPFPVGRLEIGYAHPLKTNNSPFNSFFWAFDVQFF